MDSTQESIRYRRGNPSPVNDGLIFLRYKRGKEVWITPAQMERVNAQKHVNDAKWRNTDNAKAIRNAYAKEYLKSDKRKAWRAEYQKRPEVVAARKERYATDEKERQRIKAYATSDKAKQSRKKSAQKRKGKISTYMREYSKKWHAIPINKLAHNLRSRMKDALKCQGVHKKSKSKELVGCTFEFFRGWLESQFKEGMTWDNYGSVWSVDHIKPVALFNLFDTKQQTECFHYSNCRPMWKLQNISKNDRVEGELFRGRDYRKMNLHQVN